MAALAASYDVDEGVFQLFGAGRGRHEVGGAGAVGKSFCALAAAFKMLEQLVFRGKDLAAQLAYLCPLHRGVTPRSRQDARRWQRDEWKPRGEGNLHVLSKR